MALDYTREMEPRMLPGLGTSAAWHIIVQWFEPSSNIVSRDFGPPISNAPGKWAVQPRRVTNLQWFEANKEKLGRFAGRWVAVNSQAIVVDAASFAEVHATLTERNITGALIVRVPENVTNRPRLIA